MSYPVEQPGRRVVHDLFFFLAVPPTGELSVTLFKQTRVGTSMLGDGIIDAIVLAWILSFPGSSGPTGIISRERR